MEHAYNGNLLHAASVVRTTIGVTIEDNRIKPCLSFTSSCFVQTKKYYLKYLRS